MTTHHRWSGKFCPAYILPHWTAFKALVSSYLDRLNGSGDVDGDGKVTAADARTALRAAVGIDDLNDLQKAAADADGDGKITAADARAILHKSVGGESA